MLKPRPVSTLLRHVVGLLLFGLVLCTPAAAQDTTAPTLPAPKVETAPVVPGFDGADIAPVEASDIPACGVGAEIISESCLTEPRFDVLRGYVPDALHDETEIVQIAAAPNAAIKLAAMQPPEIDTPHAPEISTAAPAPPPPRTEAEPPAPSATPLPTLRPRAKPAKKKQSASAGVAPQKSAGSGGSANAGNRGSAATSTLSKGQEAKLIAVWGARIRSHIERKKRQPSGTRAMGEVVLKMSVDRNGRLQTVSVRRSSGDARLDAAAVAAVQRAGRFPPAPNDLPGTVFGFSLGINFGR